MIMNEIKVSIEPLIAISVIAMGEWNGVQWEYFPNIPSCFSEDIDFQNSCGCNADFLHLTVNDLGGVECWFIDENESTFFYGLNDIKKSHPLLFTSIVTHIYDVINNMEE